MLDDEMKQGLIDLIPTDDIEAVFEIIDDDDSGAVDIEEFVESITKIAMAEVPLDTLKLLRNSSSTEKKLNNILKAVKNIPKEAIAGTALQLPAVPAVLDHAALNDGWLGLMRREGADGASELSI